ncbi:MAG: hypothetical protein E7264_00560 [Lachnospiraceae bacterium]|nr:hypothetical protein [Lachnospiraceae bacterium]
MSEYYTDAHKYDDIIHLPHYQSSGRPHMSLHDRAAQFAPFAALSGHEEAIEETARVTDAKMILDEYAIGKINETLYQIAQHLQDKWRVSITYFQPDALKEGGVYLTDVGTIKRLDDVETVIIMDSGMKIRMEEVMQVEILEKE